MFASNLNYKDNPLATVWLAANLDKKLTKAQLLHTNICKTANAIINGDTPFADQSSNDASSILKSRQEDGEVLITSEPIALRLSGQLLFGIVKIYSRKERYLLDDVSDVLVKLKSIFKSNNLQSIIVPAGKTMMNINKSLLHDTVNEANIGNELLNPFNIDIDIESLMNDHENTSITADYSIEAGRDIGANLSSIATKANTRHSKIERKTSKNLKNDETNTSGNYNERDSDHEIFNNVLDLGNSMYEDDLNNNAELPDITEHQELVLDFSNTYSVEKQNIGDDSIEEGRRAALEKSRLEENDASSFNFGNLLENDKYSNIDIPQSDQNIDMGNTQDFQNNDTPIAERNQQSTDEKLDNDLQNVENKTSDDLNSIFKIGPLETIAEDQRDQQTKEAPGAESEKHKNKRQRSRGVSKLSRFGGKKKILKDLKIEISNRTFRPDDLAESQNRGSSNKINYIRDALFERRKLFYLKKFSNAGNCFIETDDFKYLWNSHFEESHGSAIQNSKNSKVFVKVDDLPETDTAEPHFEIGLDTELPTNYPDDSGIDFNLDFADNFNSGLVEDILSQENQASDIMETEEEEEVEMEGDKQKETFFHRESANDFTSSLADSFSNKRSNSINSAEELENDDTFADEISQTSQYNLPENQLNEEPISGNSISKSTLKVADILKEEFSSDIKKNVTLNTVIELDQNTEEPLSKTLKKQATRCLFELLVLATKDAVTLKQENLFGDISVKPRDNLYIL